jgi:hypothetical protein
MVECRQKPWQYSEMVDCEITEQTPDNKVKEIASDMLSDTAKNKMAWYYEN